MKRSKRVSRAFTIVEVIVIIVIIGVIAAAVAPRLLSRIGQSKQSMAKVNASSLANALRTYMADCGTPESGATLDILLSRPSNVAEDAWKGPYVESAEALLDPWGTPYELVIPGRKNASFDIVSYGADKAPGGSDENADVVMP